eukprot:2755747-Prymnesium_polylepis.1
MSDWTAAELSARGPKAQPCTSPYCIRMRCTGPGPVKGVSRPPTMPSTVPYVVTYAWYVVT